MRLLPLLLVAPLLLLALPPQAVAANPTDCTAAGYALRDSTYPKWRAISFRYNRAGEPLMVWGQVEALIRAAAATWTGQVNACGVADTTAVQYELGLVTTAATGENNGRSEIFWRPCEGCGPSYARYEYAGECDIILNSTWGDSTGDALYHHADVLASILAREMGWCIGLKDSGVQMTTMGGGWCEDAFTRYFATQGCGLTLAKGDMDGLRLLWPL